MKEANIIKFIKYKIDTMHELYKLMFWQLALLITMFFGMLKKIWIPAYAVVFLILFFILKMKYENLRDDYKKWRENQ